MENTTYTVIVPHKDTPDLLQRCMNSIPQRDDVQIIVVDDNSDPNIVDFNNFPGSKRNNVECYFTKEGKGAGYARNIGLKHAHGKWLLFADSDDFFHDDMLSMLDKWKDSDNEIVYFDNDSVICETLAPTNKRTSYIYTDYESELRYSWGIPWSKMISRELTQRHHINFDETIVANDVMFSLKCGFWASKVCLSHDVLYCATVRTNSLIKSSTLNNLLCRLLVCTSYNKFILKHRIDKATLCNYERVKEIHHEYGLDAYLKALRLYLSHEPWRLIIRYIISVIRFTVKRIIH